MSKLRDACLVFFTIQLAFKVGFFVFGWGLCELIINQTIGVRIELMAFICFLLILLSGFYQKFMKVWYNEYPVLSFCFLFSTYVLFVPFVAGFGFWNAHTLMEHSTNDELNALQVGSLVFFSLCFLEMCIVIIWLILNDPMATYCFDQSYALIFHVNNENTQCRIFRLVFVECLAICVSVSLGMLFEWQSSLFFMPSSFVAFWLYFYVLFWRGFLGWFLFGLATFLGAYYVRFFRAWNARLPPFWYLFRIIPIVFCLVQILVAQRYSQWFFFGGGFSIFSLLCSLVMTCFEVESDA